MSGLVGRLDVDDEQVEPVAEPVDRRVALGLVVGVVPGGRAVDVGQRHVGEHAEPADEVDGGGDAAAHAVLGLERRHRRLEALTPQPHLVRGEIEAIEHRPAALHDLAQAWRGGAGRPDGRLAGEVVGRRAVGVDPVGRRHHDVAVLDAGVELEARAAGAPTELGVERLDHLLGVVARSGWPPAKSTIVPSSPTVTRLQR